MEQQQGKRGATGIADMDHTVAAVLLSLAGINKDAHPDQLKKLILKRLLPVLFYKSMA